MATAAIELDKDAFMRLVTEEHLQVEGPSAGYLYTGKKGKNGWELYKTPNNPWYMWSYRQICTQDAVGGGNLVVTVTCGAGIVAKFNCSGLIASGNRASTQEITDAAGNRRALLTNSGAAAGNASYLPALGSAANASNNMVPGSSVWLSPNNIFKGTVVAAAQTETATFTISLLSTSITPPTVSWAGSGGTPNVAVATENTVLQMVML